MIKCEEMYTVNGKVVCEKGYVSGNNKSNYAILMHLEHEYCNMCCKYCVCHPKPSNEDTYNYYKADYSKMISLIKETDKKRHMNENAVHNFELWGGEPLFNFKSFSELVEVLRKEWPDCSLSTSTNGLVLKDENICNFLITNKINIQLSHDGLGQHVRGKDPLEDKETLENCKALISAGILRTINTTLSAQNPSWNDNINYWWGKFDCSKLNIKLNHPYNSDYDFDFAFIDEAMLRKYMTEFVSLFYQCSSKEISKRLRPFANYILEQGHRYGEGESDSSCRAYQSFVHNIDGNRKQDWNFVITTEGKYSECELYEQVDNPGGQQPDYCNNCKYKNQKECKQCGAMKYPKKCIYGKAWLETLEIINNGIKCNSK